MRDVECLMLALVVGSTRVYIKHSFLMVKQVGIIDATIARVRAWHRVPQSFFVRQGLRFCSDVETSSSNGRALARAYSPSRVHIDWTKTLTCQYSHGRTASESRRWRLLGSDSTDAGMEKHMGEGK